MEKCTFCVQRVQEAGDGLPDRLLHRAVLLAHDHSRALRVAQQQSARLGKPVKFLFPSSIAVYGLPDLDAKRAAGKVADATMKNVRASMGMSLEFESGRKR